MTAGRGVRRPAAANRPDEATAHFVAALDTSIARGDLETSRQDLATLLGRPSRPSPKSYPRRTPPHNG